VYLLHVHPHPVEPLAVLLEALEPFGVNLFYHDLPELLALGQPVFEMLPLGACPRIGV